MMKTKPILSRRRWLVGLFLALMSFHSYTAASDKADEFQAGAIAFDIPRGTLRVFPEPPPVPEGALSAELDAAVDSAFGDLAQTGWREAQVEALATIAASADPRLAWLISDLTRIVSNRDLAEHLAAAASRLLGVDVPLDSPWGFMVDHLIAWDIPAPPGYLEVKRGIYALALPGVDKLFESGAIDWRHVSWGGVLIDDRPFGKTDEPCNCIPAADNPEVTNAAEATWLKDGDIVFGIGINGEYRAYPRRIMEVREMINDTLGGRDLGIPYCTLCGSAQAYLTDEVPNGVDRPVLRTSGLLIRSNKVMYDVNTYSVFDTFTGEAVTGPLANQGVALNQVSVVTSTWGEWKASHPETTVMAESLALGRDFDFRNNRDADGPIFPIGDVDPRLPVHEDVLGVITESGLAIAFHVATARSLLSGGESIEYENVLLQLDGSGIRAATQDGRDLGGHQAFWFAWSQFHPGTRLWPHDDDSSQSQ